MKPALESKISWHQAGELEPMFITGPQWVKETYNHNNNILMINRFLFVSPNPTVIVINHFIHPTPQHRTFCHFFSSPPSTCRKRPRSSSCSSSTADVAWTTTVFSPWLTLGTTEDSGNGCVSEHLTQKIHSSTEHQSHTFWRLTAECSCLQWIRWCHEDDHNDDDDDDTFT